jgi:hypothetical protein
MSAPFTSSFKAGQALHQRCTPFSSASRCFFCPTQFRVVVIRAFSVGRPIPLRCPKQSESICLGRVVDTKTRHVRLDGGSTQRADAFIVHLVGMQVPTVEAQRSVQNSNVRHCCYQKFRGARRPMFPAGRSRAPANVSRRCWRPINLAGARLHRHQKPSFLRRRRQNLPARR